MITVSTDFLLASCSVAILLTPAYDFEPNTVQYTKIGVNLSIIDPWYQ